MMNIGSGNGYPDGALSNFAPHPFVIDGIECASMEGFLQSLKYSSAEMQIHVCTLVGRKAKFKGQKKRWFEKQTLWWRGVEIDRHSDEYQKLLDRAFFALSKNTKFAKALLASKDAVLKHSIGKSDPSKTILTVKEFCGRLTKIRNRLVSESNESIFHLAS